MFQIERHFIEDMLTHAKAEDPNECCGLIAGKDGRVARVFRATNSERSPVRYNVEPKELLHIDKEIESKGWELVSIYHSHTHSEAYPSATDVRLAFWSGATYLIISLQDKDNPVVRAFKIEDGVISEEQLQIV